MTAQVKIWYRAVLQWGSLASSRKTCGHRHATRERAAECGQNKWGRLAATGKVEVFSEKVSQLLIDDPELAEFGFGSIRKETRC